MTLKRYPTFANKYWLQNKTPSVFSEICYSLKHNQIRSKLLSSSINLFCQFHMFSMIIQILICTYDKIDLINIMN